jgi:hypothetical protein
VRIYAFLEPNIVILGQALFLKMTTCEMKWGILSKNMKILNFGLWKEIFELFTTYQKDILLSSIKTYNVQITYV